MESGDGADRHLHVDADSQRRVGVNNASFGTLNTTVGYTNGSKYDFRLTVTDTAGNTSAATTTG